MQSQLRVAGFVLVALILTLLVGPARSLADSLACGEVITTSTVLTADLIGCSGNGIVIGADNVSLDLNGHTISGVGEGSGVEGVGYSGITVMNGTIEGFSTGIEISCAHCDRPLKTNVLQALDVENNSGTGIWVNQNPNATLVTGDNVHGNYNGIVFSLRSFGTVSDNHVFANDNYGISRTGDSDGVISGNTVQNNEIGISASLSPNTIIDNLVQRNRSDGITTYDISPFYRYYDIASNTTDANGAYGIHVMAGSFDGDASVEDGGGNAAKHNGLTPQCVVHVFVPYQVTALPCAFNRGQAQKPQPASPAPLHDAG